jgi:hypothetical protein
MDFTNEIYVGKNNTSSFFFFVLNFFPIVIPLVNTEGNIPSVFPFVFINFLVVNINKNQVEEREKNKRTYMPHDPHSTTCTADLWKGRRDTLEVALESRFWSSDGVARAIRRWLTLLTRYFFFYFLIYQITLLPYEHPITTKWPHVNDKKNPRDNCF